MAIDEVTLWNLALGIIGGADKGLISSTSSEQAAATHCRAFWDEAVEQSIDLLRPDEARKYYNCAEVDSDDADYPENSDWSYVFSLPADYLDLIKMTDENDRTANYDHEIVGEFILTEESDCYIFYYFKLTDVSKMSPGLRRMIVAKLALMIAPHYKPRMLDVAIKNHDRVEAKAEESIYRHKYIPTSESLADIE